MIPTNNFERSKEKYDGSKGKIEILEESSTLKEKICTLPQAAEK